MQPRQKPNKKNIATINKKTRLGWLNYIGKMNARKSGKYFSWKQWIIDRKKYEHECQKAAKLSRIMVLDKDVENSLDWKKKKRGYLKIQ